MRNFFPTLARKVSNFVGSSWTFFAAFIFVLVWLITGPYFHYSDTWQLVINTSTTIITFLIVFLIQNTQNRDSEMLHLKLDELIKAHKAAHNKLIDLEELSDDELKDLEAAYKKLVKDRTPPDNKTN